MKKQASENPKPVSVSDVSRSINKESADPQGNGKVCGFLVYN
jgi:hypothetical protein